MSVYPQQINYEIKIGDTWQDISQDVIRTQSCEYGLGGNGSLDRTAVTGSLKFTLRNDKGNIGNVENYWTPGSLNGRAGWRIGIPCRLKIKFDNETFTKFYGHVGKIEPNVTEKIVNVTCLDWWDYAGKNPILSPAIQYNKHSGEVVEAIVNAMAVQPLHSTYYAGQSNFSTVFDTVRSTTKTNGEINKVILSELGYAYIKRDKADGETLVVESRHTRGAQSQVGKFIVADGLLLLEDSGLLLLETGEEIKISTTQDAYLENSMTGVETSYGENISNRVIIKTYPRRVDTSYVVLWALPNSISISAGQTIQVRGTYRDTVNGSAKVNGMDMQAPVATTDYLMNSQSNGLGTNLTASLTVAAQYGSESVVYTLTNNHSGSAYITKLQSRGKGIYFFDPVEIAEEDSQSISDYGFYETVYDMKYQDDVNTPISLASVLLAQNTEPRMMVNKVDFIFNTSESLASAFLYLDIGDLVKIKSDRLNLDTFFYINKVAFTIEQGGIIRYSWTIQEALSLDDNYWILETSQLGLDTILGY